VAKGRHSVGNAQAQTLIQFASLLPCKLSYPIALKHPLCEFRQHFRHTYPSTALLANLESLSYVVRMDALSCFQVASADDFLWRA
jgi:hypothetical protein